MPQRVNIVGYGDVEFPDGMSEADMSAAIMKNMPQFQKQGPWQDFAPANKPVGQMSNDELIAAHAALMAPKPLAEMSDAELRAAHASATGQVTLNIGGRRVKVDPRFLSLSPEQQNATVDEISGKLPPGYTLDKSPADMPPGVALDKPDAPWLSSAKDFFKSIPRGALSGISSAMSAAGQAAAHEMSQPDLAEQIPTPKDTTKILEQNVTGDLPQPQGRAGKYGAAIGETLGNPVSYVGPGGLATKLATNIMAATGGEAAGQAAEGTKAEPYARIAGTLLGSYSPNLLGRAFTPLPTAPARQALVDTLRNEGVTSLTAGQRTGREGLRYAESALGNSLGAGSQTNRITAEGQSQFTQAALRRAGAAGENAAPEVLAANQRRLGDAFEDLSTRNTMVMDRQFVTDINQATRQYQRVPPSQQRSIVEGYVDDIMQHAQAGGVMPGTYYQEMRSRLSRQANSLRQTDPTLSEALRDMRDALDNAMRRSIAPADREAWDTVRREYGAQKVIEKTASRAGEATAEGQLVPSNLRNTVSAENRGAYARGEGQFADLARAGAGVMAPMPQSGTGPRVAMHTMASLLGGALGGAGGLGAGSGLGAVAGAIAGPAIAGRVLMSRPMQGYLGNQVATPLMRNLNPRRAALVNALIAAQH